MKFNRLTLIDRCDHLIAAAKAAKTRADADYANALIHHREAYVDLHRDGWAKFADNIRRAVRVGRPVTSEDVPEGLRRTGGGVDFYHKWWSPTSRVREYPQAPDSARYDTRELSTLREFLRSVTGDEVTQAGLDRAGFRNLAPLFREPRNPSETE